MLKKRSLALVILLLAVFVLATFCACDCTAGGNGGIVDDGNGNTGGNGGIVDDGNGETDDNKGDGDIRTETVYADFYAINDFHGETDKMSTVAGYLAEVKYNNENVVLINSGDMFQGSMYSNSNYGNLLSDCMDDVGFDSFTLGNHEFDWGLEKLAALSAQSATPFLGANIYHWNADQKTWGTFADELAQEYVVKTLPNGVKVGIIGVIGKDQITSISSNLVQTIGFKDPAAIIPDLSQKLRNELHCDVVVVSAHTGQDTFLENKSFDITKYADVVFCAHTHKAETSYRNGVAFIQGGSSGSNVSHVKLSVAPNGEVTTTVYENIRYSSSWPNRYTVSELIDNSNEKIEAEANQFLAQASAYMNKKTAIPRLACHAMAEYALAAGHDIDVALCNNARAYFSEGTVTYSDLYSALPFDNTIYIARVLGSDIINEVQYCSVWRVSEEAINPNEYYTIAVLDYLLFHQNSNRDYNYFPSAFTSGFTPVALTKDGYENYNYRYITRDFLLGLSGGTLDATLYTNTNLHTDTSKLQSSVSFAN